MILSFLLRWNIVFIATSKLPFVVGNGSIREDNIREDVERSWKKINNRTQRHQKSLDWKQQTQEETDRQMDTGAGSGD